ncbi:MAG: hypothetical protein K8W52_06540 [Deltaproteobacteria bacterium]|nr:hypothetical protein [Deltaproteobacteria bacterium]
MRTIFMTVAMVAAAAVAGCGGGGGTVDKYDARAVDAGIIDATTPSDDASCFTNPTTHNEIINACTDAQPVAKDPTLPLLLDDGGLPPLPQ